MSKDFLHDWTLVRIDFEWQSSRVTMELLDSASAAKMLVAEGVIYLNVPKANEWGPSVSVNEAYESAGSADGMRRLCIEMQSGDVISVIAKDIVMPSQ